MAATVNLKEIIENKHYDWIDAIFVNLFPVEMQGATEKTVAIITESDEQPTDWGNDTFNSISNELEVEIFYSDDFRFDMQKAEVTLMKDLEKEGYRISNSRSHFVDPDTGQIVKTIYVQIKNKI